MSRRDYYHEGLGVADEYTPVDVASTTPSGATTSQSANSWSDVAKNAVPALISVYQQQQMQKVNQQRMNSGQAPYTSDEYAMYFQPPAASVSVGLDANTKKMAMYAGVGLIALFLLKR